MEPTPYDIARFWVQARPEARNYATPCWIWQGTTNGRYGTFYYRGGPSRSTRTGRIFAHRFAWLATTGELPSVHICHRCDEPLCVNPDHLFTGTQADNLLDMIHKGRSANIKLTRTQRLEIAARVAHGERPSALAREYSVTDGAVQYIIRRSKEGRL